MDLIQLSREKGFISKDNLITVDASYYYLWMCELQKWLREVHSIDVLIEGNRDLIKRYNINFLNSNNNTQFFLLNQENKIRHFSNYEEALEIGLQEALKLIP